MTTGTEDALRAAADRAITALEIMLDGEGHDDWDAADWVIVRQARDDLSDALSLPSSGEQRDEVIEAKDRRIGEAVAAMQSMQRHLQWFLSDDSKANAAQREIFAEDMAAVSAFLDGSPKGALPDDVRDLVIAARLAFAELAFVHPVPGSITALDKAAECFADRVPWDDDPAMESTPAEKEKA